VKNRTSSFTILTLLFLFSTVLAGGPSSWPYFHPNYGRSTVAIPEAVSLRWQVNFGDSVQIYPTTSPITGWINQHQQEVVYLGTSIGVFCLSAESGEVIWFYHTVQPVKYAPAYWDTNRLYVPAGDSLICLDPATGQWIWGYHCHDVLFHVIGLGNYIGVIDASSYVYVFNYQTNQLAWQVGPLASGAGCDNTSLALDNHGCVYAVTCGNALAWYDFKIFKFDLTSGQQIWSYDDWFAAEPGGVRMSPGLRHDSLLVFGTHAAYGWTSSIYNYRASDHQQTWRRTFTYSDGPVMASPAVDTNGYTYFPTANFLLALDDSNNQRWQYDFPFDASSPAIDLNHKIIFGTTDGQLLILNQLGGVAYQADSLGDSLTSPAIGSDGSIYIASDMSVLYKFGDVVVAQDEPRSARGLSGIKIYPNPFRQRLTINSLSGVKIYSLDGRRVFAASRGLVVWRPVGLQSGVYLVKTNQQMIKVVKK